MQRRRFLQAATGGAVVGLAGCTTANGSVAPPQVPESTLAEQGWTLRSESMDETVYEGSMGPLSVEAIASRVSYEKTSLATEISEVTMGKVETAPMTFTATRIDIHPPLDELGPVRSELETRIENHARDQLVDQLTEAGVQEVSQKTTTPITLESGTTTEVTEYEGIYPVEDVTVPIMDKEQITIESPDLPITALLAVWTHNDDGYLVGGGAYPAENIASSTQEALTDAITVTVDVDLGLEPQRYRDELIDLISRIA